MVCKPMNWLRNHMETFLYWAIGVGCVALLLAISTLLWLNASEKTIAPIVSILMVGAATTLVGLVLSLKETTNNSDFAMSVVLNTRDGRPPLEVTDAPPGKANVQLQALFELSRPAVNKDGKAVFTDTAPTNDAERIAFASELIQYRLVRLVQELQRGRTSGGFSYGTSFATVTAPIKTSDSVDLPLSEISAALTGNRFSNSAVEKFHWEKVGFPLPKGTTLALQSPAADQSGQYAVVIAKPLYFRITFAISTLPWTSAGALPQGLSLRPELAPFCQTYHFRVAMSAIFEKLTSGNYRTQEYKDWVATLFDDVRNRLSD
jgi:hypothetical protein